MVKKVAVIALVAIIAIPILLGYGFNLTPVSVTEYKNNEDPVNVTPLLQNGVGYNYAHASVYDLNTIFRHGSVPVNPRYVQVGSNPSILPMYQLYYGPDGSALNLSMALVQWADVFTYLQSDYHGITTGYIRLDIKDDNNTVVLSVSNIHTVYYDPDTLRIMYSYYPSLSDQSTLSFGLYTAANTNYVMGLFTVGTNTMDSYAQLGRSNATTFVNLSKGFYFSGTPSQWYIDIPHNTFSILMTVDLDSITDSNYSLHIYSLGRIYFDKTSGDWTATYRNHDGTTESIDLYTNPLGNNTYQIEYHFKDLGNDGVNYNYNEKIDLHYVGKWPTLMGKANSYIDYSFTDDYTYNAELTTSVLTLNSNLPKTPIMRMDDAEYRAMEFPIIQNTTYTPSQFRSNPSTTITNIGIYGTSITFGGQTFTVDDTGNITIGTKQFSVSKCVFESLPITGGYENRINGILINQSVTPSQLVFNGRWFASVATNSLVQNTYDKTDWHVGEFGWDGLDQNFLMVGLLTCLGVFVALGIYARKTGSGGMIPLMIVTGCAAMLFFVML